MSSSADRASDHDHDHDGDEAPHRAGAFDIRTFIAFLIGIYGIVLVLVVRHFVVGGGSSDGKKPVAKKDTRTGCTGLAVTASSEKAALLGQIGEAYAAADHRVNGKCVKVTVTSKASGGAEEALARGWDAKRDGPRPDVWSPASSSWTVLLQQSLTAADRPALVPATTPSIAQTPLVLAMPRPMAQALGWPDKALGWGDLLALSRNPAGWGAYKHPEWGKFTLGKTNPNFSTSGLNATIGTYFAATGRSSDLSAADVADPKVVAYVKGVESSVVHYGDTTLTFLANLAAADKAGQGLTYISAVTIEEKSVWDYNQGNPSGDPKTLGKSPKPRTPLVAIYPKEGTLLSDSPYVVLTAPWVDDAKRAAAADFLSYVQADARQQIFQKAAFRSFSGKPGPPVTEANGMLPKQKITVIDPPSPPVLRQVERQILLLRGQNVILDFDLAELYGVETRALKQAVRRNLERFPDDRGDPLAVSARGNVHVHNTRRFIQQMIVKRCLLDTPSLKGAHYRTHLFFGEDKISHNDRPTASRLLERHPAAKR